VTGLGTSVATPGRATPLRIVLAADGTRGDVHPLLALARRLGLRGHAVTLCAPPDFADDAAAVGVPFQAVGASVRDYLATQAAVLAGRPLRLLREALHYSETSIAAQFAVVPEVAAGADLVIGGGVQGAAASAAELNGAAYRYVVYCPNLLPSRAHPPFVVPRASLPTWANDLAWLATRALATRGLGRPLNRERVRRGLRPVRDVLAHLLSERPLLAADRELAPCPADVSLAVEQIPCLHPFAPASLPPKLEAFLDAGPPPVYFGFGSMTDEDAAGTTRVILEAVASLGCRALVSQGWAQLGEGPLPEGVLAVEAVSHAALFPRVAAVVHHGGAGTTTTAARAGVPQVLVPHLFDQHYWARRVCELGLGPPPVPRRRLAGERLAAALRSLDDNELVRERARELGARLRAEIDAAPPVERLLSDVRGSS
jgi:vancomycin aglycone glucosyltransferase